MIYGNQHKPSGAVILHLDRVQTAGQANHELPTVQSLRDFIREHPEIEKVDFADSRMPRRPVATAAVTDAMLRKFYRAAA